MQQTTVELSYLKAEMPRQGEDDGWSITWRGKRGEANRTTTSRCLRRDDGIVGKVVLLVSCTSPQTCNVGGGSGSLPPCFTGRGTP